MHTITEHREYFVICPMFQQCVDCPAAYSGDPAESLVCNLWLELETKQQQQAGGGMTAVDSGAVISTTANLAPVSCLYQDHSTSSGSLCSLWCQIQVFEV